MPIERTSISTLSMFSSLMSTDNCRISLKYGRLSSGFSTYGAIVISPRIWTCSICATSRTGAIVSSLWIPNLLSSSAIFTSIRIGTITLFLAACFSISFARCKLSTEWINAVFPTMYFTLLVCKCPIICQWMSFGSTSIFSHISCNLFSPNSRIFWS